MAEVRSRHISFMAELVKAIEGGYKNMTRRLPRVQPTGELLEHLERFSLRNFISPQDGFLYIAELDGSLTKTDFRSRYGKPGDLLWVKETWQTLGMGVVAYRSDHGDDWEAYDMPEPCSEELIQELRKGWKWKSPRYMPKWASRRTLRIEKICLERVQDIGEIDAYFEGCPPDWQGESYEWFEKVWRDINGDKSWDENDWVEVISFEVVKE